MNSIYLRIINHLITFIFSKYNTAFSPNIWLYPCIFFTTDTSSLNEPVLQEQVEKLNRQNTEHSHINIEAEGDGRSGRQDLETLILEEPHTSVAQSDERQEEAEERQDEEGEGGIFEDSEPEEQEKEEEKQNGEDVSLENRGKVKDDVKTTHREESSKSEKAWLCRASVLQYDRCVLAKLPYIFMLLAIKFIKLTIYFLYLYFFGSLSQLRGNYFVGGGKGELQTTSHIHILCLPF